jgi:hypothetical protein
LLDGKAMKRQRSLPRLGLFLAAVAAAGCGASVSPDSGTDAATNADAYEVLPYDAMPTNADAYEVLPYDAMPTTCGTQTCPVGSVCLHSTSLGGVGHPMQDGGGCPDGSLAYGMYCRDLTESFACQPIPAACGGGAPTCGCAAAICNPSPGYADCVCNQPAAGSSTLECGCSYP